MSSAFYATTNSSYDPKWKATQSYDVIKAEIPKISDVLAAKELVRKPLYPEIDFNKYTLQREFEAAVKERQGDAVLSAHILPVKFPVRAERMEYPAIAKRGADNPLYSTSSRAVGNKPMAHQIAEYYFPKNNDFTNKYTDSRPRYTGLRTQATPSKIHSSMDTFY